MTPPTEPAPIRDSIGQGVFPALLWQLGSIIVSAPLFFSCWGLIQWCALIPLYRRRKRQGYPLAAKGVLIVGFIGLLLNATCTVAILGNLGNMK